MFAKSVRMGKIGYYRHKRNLNGFFLNDQLAEIEVTIDHRGI